MSKTLNESLNESLMKDPNEVLKISKDDDFFDVENEIPEPVAIDKVVLRNTTDEERGKELLNKCVWDDDKGLVIEEQKEYGRRVTLYFWDDEQKVIWKATRLNNAGYELTDMTLDEMKKECGEYYEDLNKKQIANLQRKKVPLNGWDKFVSFFGFKTDRIRRNERVDKMIGWMRDNDMRSALEKTGITDETILPKKLSRDETTILWMEGEAQEAYLKTGKMSEHIDVESESESEIGDDEPEMTESRRNTITVKETTGDTVPTKPIERESIRSSDSEGLNFIEGPATKKLRGTIGSAGEIEHQESMDSNNEPETDNEKTENNEEPESITESKKLDDTVIVEPVTTVPVIENNEEPVVVTRPVEPVTTVPVTTVIENNVEPSAAAQAIKTINTYAPALNTAYDHMMHSIEGDKTAEDKTELYTAAYLISKHYNDKLVALKNGDPNVEFTGMEEGCIGYLSRCGNSSLVNICKTVAGVVRKHPKEKPIDVEINFNNIIGNEINKNAGLEKEDVYKPVRGDKQISFPIKMDEIAEALGK